MYIHVYKIMYIHVYKIRIASWPAVHVCEGSLQVSRFSAILLYIFLGKIFSHY